MEIQMITTLLLMMSVFAISTCIGTFSAIAAWRSRSLVAAVFPVSLLSIPPWLLGYYISDAFDVYGFTGASISMGITCSVYVHAILTTRLFNQAQSAYEVYSLYHGPGLRTALTAAFPSIRASLPYALSLVAAEVFTDFGTVNFFGVNTVSMMMYNAWISTWSVPLLSLLQILVFTSVIAAVSFPKTLVIDDMPLTSNVVNRVLAVIPSCAVILFCIGTSFMYLGPVDIQAVMGSLIVAITCACISIALAVFQLVFNLTALTLLSAFMYAVPGVLIGYAISNFGLPLFPSMVVGLVARYSVLIVLPVSVGHSKLNDVCAMYIEGFREKTLFKIKATRIPILIGTLLVLLDILRELPITMMLRPAGFETLALKMNYIAKTEFLDGIGAYALILIALNLLLIFSITKLRNSNGLIRKPAPSTLHSAKY